MDRYKNQNHSRFHLYFIIGKICENPIEPQKISGRHSGNYNEASFKKMGWCGSGSAPYLLIDLGKEYHITRVVVMGNSEQTKWSESCSMRYSHSQTLLDSIKPIEVIVTISQC